MAKHRPIRSAPLFAILCALLLAGCAGQTLSGERPQSQNVFAFGAELSPRSAPTAAPDVALETWQDVDGVSHHPLDVRGASPTVLLFVATDCPISNGYTPEVNRIIEAYAPRGVRFLAVHADPSVSAEAARTHAREFGYGCPVLLDPRQTLARRAGATVTPEAAVIDAGGRVAYVGRIDDLYAGYGKRRHAATTRELRDALDAVLAGRPVARPRVAAIGCDIPYLVESPNDETRMTSE